MQPFDKLLFVGMPPRAMRAFARVVIFPSFGHARFFLACVVQYVIASQCTHWRGNPHPLMHFNDEIAKKENGLPHQ